ncbi:flagellar biosynthetic protein FliP [Tatumella sp. TA1]|uniref:flagellar type III secretion system pore protein FliP n=1 Tax=Rosenbergiella collisarenosi TaxID=1544695 RepID=UPI0008F976B8|nr:flagellar type III secretion system pore protein FliP [Rosenbergiella collisarenosi]MBT0721905.1 flagellar type III secretion system pore protein FliP [Rosenbergiella collisarenosi]QGX92726.1 flagellar biosynthetic protein FliP [Tatumella sp. TA1]
MNLGTRGLCGLLALTLLFSFPAFAADAGLPLFTTQGANGTQQYSVNIEILALMTLLGLLPIMVLMMTSFTRFIIVLAILRQALGLQQTPPNKVLTGIALCLTLLVMRPVWTTINQQAIQPYQAEQISLTEALQRASSPLKKFMLAQTSKPALAQIMSIAKVSGDPQNLDLTVITPAYLLSELKTAFQIGFMIYLPFLVIDLIVSSILMAMGMMMLSPMVVSLPFKLLLFVLCDGWTLITGTLTHSIQGF